ncbi:hypothetical protein ES703_02122 [subsurface metagenome]
MVRKQLWRKLKFEAKLDGSVIEKRTDAYRTTQVALHTAMATILVDKEIEAKTTILEPAGVPVNEMPFYLNAMREFCRNSRNFTSVTRENECVNIYLKYVEKGLVPVLVARLGVMCECELSAYYY